MFFYLCSNYATCSHCSGSAFVFFADLEPVQNLNADPGPGCQSNADPDPGLSITKFWDTKYEYFDIFPSTRKNT
jgi:hypothetical protein